MTASRLKDLAIKKLLSFTGTQKFLTAQLDITNACNLSCAHCYQPHHSNRGALSFSDWRGILDQYGRLLRKLRLRPRFSLSGGEPTLSPLLIPMLEELNSRWPGVRIAILTNATRLTPELVGFLQRFNVWIQVSLDGPDRERHDLIRGRGSFEAAIAGLRRLQDGGLTAALLATLSHRTSFWIDDFFETASRLEGAAMSFARFVPRGAGRVLAERWIDRPLSRDELRTAYLAIVNASRRTKIPTNTDLPLFHLIDPRLGANGKAGFQGLIIDYRGNLKVSSRTDLRLGNILEEGLETLFLDHPIMRALRDRKIEGCGTCPHYARCGGDRNASFVATGSFLKKDPCCWLDAGAEEDSWRSKRDAAACC